MKRFAAILLFGVLALPGFARAATCSIEKGVANIVAAEQGKKAADVSPSDKFSIDGPQTMEDGDIKQGVEETFNVKIPDAEWAKLTYVSDIDLYLRAHMAGCN